MAAAHPQHQDVPRTLAMATLPPRVRLVLEGQLQLVAADLARKLPVVLMETDQQQARQGQQTTQQNVQMAAFEATRLLRAAEAGLVACVMRELEAGLAGLQGARGTRRLEDAAVPGQGLTLLDDSETNEGAMLANIASRSDARNSLALQLMGYRYGVLAGAPAFDAEHHPLGPHALCHALRTAALAADLSLDVRLQVYRQFEKVALPHYPALLDDLNAQLAQDGILPHLSFVPVRLRPASDGSSEALRTIDVASGLALETSQGEGPARFPGGPRPPATPAMQPVGGGVGLPRVDAFVALQGLLARRRLLLAKLRPGGTDERVRQPLAREEVLDSLRRARGGGAKPGTLAEIRQTVLAQARQMHGHGVALTDADSDSFELFNLFMTQLQREMRDGAGATLVERLKLPLLQLALREHRFFVDATHPARMLLDAVSLAGAPWLGEDDIDAQWLGLLQRAVSTVQEDAEATHDTFMAANHALQGGLRAAARKNEMAERRQVEAARGRERLELARQRAADEISRLVAGRPLPRFHVVLLEQAWTDVLSLSLLRNGEDSDTWRELRDATAAIVDAGMAPGTKAVDAAFVARLQEALGQVGYHLEDAGAIARQLANGPAEDVDLASRTELIVQLKARARLGGDDPGPAAQVRPPRTDAEQAAYATLAGLAEACWIEMLDPSEERAIRRRLAWVSPRSGHALILNRRGLRVAGDDLDALARLIAAGHLRLLDADTYPAAVAWQATFANLARIAGDDAARESRDVRDV